MAHIHDQLLSVAQSLLAAGTGLPTASVLIEDDLLRPVSGGSIVSAAIDDARVEAISIDGLTEQRAVELVIECKCAGTTPAAARQACRALAVQAQVALKSPSAWAALGVPLRSVALQTERMLVVPTDAEYIVRASELRFLLGVFNATLNPEAFA